MADQNGRAHLGSQGATAGAELEKVSNAQSGDGREVQRSEICAHNCADVAAKYVNIHGILSLGTERRQLHFFPFVPLMSKAFRWCCSVTIVSVHVLHPSCVLFLAYMVPSQT